MIEREGSGRQFPLGLNYYLKQMWLGVDVLSCHQISTRLGAHFDPLITRSSNDLCCLIFQRDPISNVDNYRYRA